MGVINWSVRPIRLPAVADERSAGYKELVSVADLRRMRSGGNSHLPLIATGPGVYGCTAPEWNPIQVPSWSSAR